jgi:chromate transporter
MNNKSQISLLTLFFSMITISTFTFGGGFVIISMMRKKFCDELHWVTDDEVLDMTAIAQSAPGPLGVNSAVIFGYRIKGIPGGADFRSGNGDTADRDHHYRLYDL